MRRQHTKNIYSVHLGGNRYFVENTKTGEAFETEDVQALARYIRDDAKSEEHIPIGTAIHSLFAALGAGDCVPCAEREGFLNRLVRNPFR